jgi:hypothetical protein
VGIVHGPSDAHRGFPVLRLDAKNLSRETRAVYLYIYKDGGTLTFSRRDVGSD